jgi:hypothetical protein
LDINNHLFYGVEIKETEFGFLTTAAHASEVALNHMYFIYFTHFSGE